MALAFDQLIFSQHPKPDCDLSELAMAEIMQSDAFHDWMRDSYSDDPIGQETKFGEGWTRKDFAIEYVLSL